MHEALVPFLLGFATGSIPVAWLLVRFATRRDVSLEGSGNVGALNASRVAKSKAVGIGVMVLDVCKGAAAVWLAVAWQGGWAFEALAAATLGAVAGHNYNPWLSIARRKLVGGKGFAAASGGLLMVRPWIVPLWLAALILTWVVLRRTRGIVDEAPSSTMATLAMIPVGWWVYDLPTAWMTAGIALLCVPKILPELPAVFAEARDRRAEGAPAPDATETP